MPSQASVPLMVTLTAAQPLSITLSVLNKQTITRIMTTHSTMLHSMDQTSKRQTISVRVTILEATTVRMVSKEAARRSTTTTIASIRRTRCMVRISRRANS